MLPAIKYLKVVLLRSRQDIEFSVGSYQILLPKNNLVNNQVFSYPFGAKSERRTS